MIDRAQMLCDATDFAEAIQVYADEQSLSDEQAGEFVDMIRELVTDQDMFDLRDALKEPAAA